jgi:tetratricopeptide (TPR) repeat protein
MSSSQITYNPGILGETELVRSFVVRQKSLELILEAIRENSTAVANRHLLIIGPRGIGKTMLVRRAATAVRSNPEYSKQWYPLVFGEESYPVSTAGEFWLEAIFHLADQTGEDRLQKTFAELRDEHDDMRLRERALSQLLDFADRGHTRILLVVENLNTLVGEQMDQDAAWELRHTLLNEPRLMLLGTATNRLDEIAHVGHAWFEMFSVHQLQPLSVDECGELWRSVTGTAISTDPLKAIRILTGGNPRLLKILATFAANHSFRELMEQLVHLIDDHTEYFKGHLDALAAKERKVFVALLERWDPVRAADLARHTRLNASEVSALLGRLCSRGAVEVVEQRGRKKLYQASERLYNIYYLMRRRGHPEGRVQAAVQFMITFYKNQELVDRLADLAREACELPSDVRQDYYRAYTEILRRVEPIRPQVLQITPAEFFHFADVELTRAIGMPGLFGKAASLARDGKLEDAERLCRHLLELDNTDPLGWLVLGSIAGKQQHWKEAEESFLNVIQLGMNSPISYNSLAAAQMASNQFVQAEESLRKGISTQPSADGWYGLGLVLLQQERFQEGIDALVDALKLDPKNAMAWELLSDAYNALERPSESENAIREAIRSVPTARRWTQLGRFLRRSKRWQEMEDAYSKTVELDPLDGVAWGQLGRARILAGRGKEAEEACRRAVELLPNSHRDWASLGASLVQQDQFAEAEAALRKAIELDPQDPSSWRLLGHLLQETGPPERAEAVWAEALHLHPDKLASCSVHLLELRLARGVDSEIILRDAEEWVTRSSDKPDTIAAIAKFIADGGLEDGLQLAEIWARDAFKKQRDFKSSEALCTVLSKMSKWRDALAVSGPMLDEAASNEAAREASTNLIIQAAAAGWAKEAFEILRLSSGTTALEPLAVGLQIYLGETPIVAKEIYEIGSDVADRIRKHEDEAGERKIQG